MPTLDKARAPPNCCFQFAVGIIRKSACCRLCRARHKRHTFGSLLIQDGASLAYVKDQMGHSSIQITVDTYGHLIPRRILRGWTGWISKQRRNKMQPPRNLGL